MERLLYETVYFLQLLTGFLAQAIWIGWVGI